MRYISTLKTVVVGMRSRMSVMAKALHLAHNPRRKYFVDQHSNARNSEKGAHL